MNRFLSVALLVSCVTIEWCGRGLAQQPAPNRMMQLYATNNLDNEGRKPFHLKMTFQLFDLNGKPAETGTVEEWWASPTSKRVHITAPWLDEDQRPIAPDSPAYKRGSYLLSELLSEVVHPVPKFVSGMDSEDAGGQFGKLQLTCSAPKGKDVAPGLAKTLPTLCTEPGSDSIRASVFSGSSESVTRNSMGLFAGAHVALALEISFFSKPSISANITTLKSFDPASGEAQLPPPSATDAPPDQHSLADAAALSPPVVERSVANGVLAGRRTGFVQPEYPQEAKLGRLSGVVLLRALIGTDGKVHNLVPIATSNPMFTQSAVDAVSKWTYSPYLLNGVATEVDTTITVNYAMGVR